MEFVCLCWFYKNKQVGKVIKSQIWVSSLRRRFERFAWEGLFPRNRFHLRRSWHGPGCPSRVLDSEVWGCLQGGFGWRVSRGDTHMSRERGAFVRMEAGGIWERVGEEAGSGSGDDDDDDDGVGLIDALMNATLQQRFTFPSSAVRSTSWCVPSAWAFPKMLVTHVWCP